MFKDNITSLRKLHGMSQEELADKVGVSRQALSIRMRELGLLGESYLGRPNAILDVMMEDDEIV